MVDPLFAFYDMQARDDVGPEVAIARPILFKVWVMKHAVTSGRWKVIGHRSLEPDLMGPATFFKQDPLTKKFSLYTTDGKVWSEVPAEYDDCVDLEYAAVWEPEHIESRLEDHFAGRPNQWVESLRPKPRA